jgi:hypothetical protein
MMHGAHNVKLFLKMYSHELINGGMHNLCVLKEIY